MVLPPEKDEPEPDEPLWIEPPLDVTVKDFLLADATIYRAEAKSSRPIRQVGLSARWKARELVIESLAVKPGDIEGDLVVSGRITPEGDTVRAALKAQWKEVVVPENLAGRVLASRGEIDTRRHAEGLCGEGRAGRGAAERTRACGDRRHRHRRARGYCGSSSCGRARGIWR